MARKAVGTYRDGEEGEARGREGRQDGVVNPDVGQAEPFVALFQSQHILLLLISNCRKTYNLCDMSYN